MSPFPHRRRWISSLLTLWVTVVSLGVSVTHAHGGTPHHVHGVGWALDAAPSVDPTPTGPGYAAHRHLFLLGFELPDQPAPDAKPDGGTVCDGLLEPAVDSTHDFDRLVDLDLPALLPEVPASTVVADATSLALDPFDPLPTPLLSDFTLRRLTGVLRA